MDFDTVNVDGSTIVVQVAHIQRANIVNVRDIEFTSEVGRDRFVVCVRTEIDNCLFVAVSIPDLTCALVPIRIIEVTRSPCEVWLSLIAVLPGGAVGKDLESDHSAWIAFYGGRKRPFAR